MLLMSRFASRERRVMDKSAIDELHIVQSTHEAKCKRWNNPVSASNGFTHIFRCRVKDCCLSLCLFAPLLVSPFGPSGNNYFGTTKTPRYNLNFGTGYWISEEWSL